MPYFRSRNSVDMIAHRQMCGPSARILAAPAPKNAKVAQKKELTVLLKWAYNRLRRLEWDCGSECFAPPREAGEFGYAVKYHEHYIAYP